MHNLVEIEDNRELLRDVFSHAILASSDKKILDYKAKKIAAEQQATILKQNQEEIASLKNDMCEIKEMINLLLKR
jgi:TRAP-type C4-dicarboxylate transport system substrate-binding protein